MGDAMTKPKVRTIFDLSSLNYEDKHIRAHRAMVHQTDELQISVYLLEPGGRVPSHRHSASWDIAFAVEGEIEARIFEGDVVRTVRWTPQTLNLVPPGIVHELVNPSASEPAKFLLIQSPAHNFDFVKSAPAGQ